MDLYSGDIHFLFIDSYIPNARRSSFREEVFFGLQIKSTWSLEMTQLLQTGKSHQVGIVAVEFPLVIQLGLI